MPEPIAQLTRELQSLADAIKVADARPIGDWPVNARRETPALAVASIAAVAGIFALGNSDFALVAICIVVFIVSVAASIVINRKRTQAAKIAKATEIARLKNEYRAKREQLINLTV